MISAGQKVINYGKSNNSTSMNPEFFAERFELNDDYSKCVTLICDRYDHL